MQVQSFYCKRGNGVSFVKFHFQKGLLIEKSSLIIASFLRNFQSSLTIASFLGNHTYQLSRISTDLFHSPQPKVSPAKRRDTKWNPRGLVKLIQRVKIAHIFLHLMSKLNCSTLSFSACSGSSTSERKRLFRSPLLNWRNDRFFYL